MRRGKTGQQLVFASAATIFWIAVSGTAFGQGGFSGYRVTTGLGTGNSASTAISFADKNAAVSSVPAGPPVSLSLGSTIDSGGSENQAGTTPVVVSPNGLTPLLNKRESNLASASSTVGASPIPENPADLPSPSSSTTASALFPTGNLTFTPSETSDPVSLAARQTGGKTVPSGSLLPGLSTDVPSASAVPISEAERRAARVAAAAPFSTRADQILPKNEPLAVPLPANLPLESASAAKPFDLLAVDRLSQFPVPQSPDGRSRREEMEAILTLSEYPRDVTPAPLVLANKKISFSNAPIQGPEFKPEFKPEFTQTVPASSLTAAASLPSVPLPTTETRERRNRPETENRQAVNLSTPADPTNSDQVVNPVALMNPALLTESAVLTNQTNAANESMSRGPLLTAQVSNNPAQNQVQNPAQNPAQNPIQNPIQNPAQNPAQNPVQSQIQNQAQNPIQNQIPTPPQASVSPAQAAVPNGSTVPPATSFSPTPPGGTLPAQVGAATVTANGVVPPPEGFHLSDKESELMDQFLLKWEEFGRNIKKVACEVHVKEHDGGLFQNQKTPISHTWGKFRFIAPNKLSYHVEGEFIYKPGSSSEETPKPDYKKGSGELKFVCDGKSWTEYDFRKRVATVYPIPEDQWNMDLTMDGPFPLFFIANAKNLKNRFYMRIVTPPDRQEAEVWIEAWPRQSIDTGNFQKILVALRRGDLQPYYMRKYYPNGKSYSDLQFQNIAINKGLWNIDAGIDFGWKKEVRNETFIIAPSAAPAPTPQPTSGLLPETSAAPAKLPTSEQQ